VLSLTVAFSAYDGPFMTSNFAIRMRSTTSLGLSSIGTSVWVAGLFCVLLVLYQSTWRNPTQTK
jgi:hypothetical protein